MAIEGRGAWIALGAMAVVAALGVSLWVQNRPPATRSVPTPTPAAAVAPDQAAARLPTEPPAVEPFAAYERRVLPLLARHGGRLDRRLRTADGHTEVHVLSFADRSGYDAYVAEPDRAAASRVLDGLDIDRLLLEVTDVDPS